MYEVPDDDDIEYEEEDDDDGDGLYIPAEEDDDLGDEAVWIDNPGIWLP